MFAGYIFLSVLFYAGFCYGSFEILARSDSLDCKETAIQCINDTSFTTCVNIENLTILTKVVLHCPDGYNCDHSTQYPCILPLPTTTTAATTITAATESTTTTVASTNSTVSTDSTTKTIVPRPSGPPTCTAVGLWPAPACNQYYECVETTSWIFWKSYNPELRTCSDGNYYDTGKKECIEAALSDCVA